MKHPVRLLYALLFLVSVSLFLVLNEKSCVKADNCSDLNNFRQENYSVEVSTKYIDSNNHSLPIIVLIDGTSLIFVKDTSMLYYYIQKKDLMVKKSGTDSIIVFRNKFIKKFKIYWGCDK